MTLDMELAALMHHVAEAGSFADLLADPAGMQRLEAFSGADLPYTAPAVPIRSVEAPGPNGPVPIRIYGPGILPLGGDRGSAAEFTSGAGLPGLVWLHGGGFAGGALDMREADQVARELADRTGGLVFSVEYRLARDGVHFPVPHEDVLAAWIWAAAHAEELGVAPGSLCLGGASAGGNLAVGAAMYLKDAGLAPPAKLLLAYPFLHAVLPSPDSAAVPDGRVLSSLPRILRFTEDDCRAMVENYIGGPAGMASSYALPGHADPSGLPPVAVIACEYDDLRPSAEHFRESLHAAGVQVAFRLEAGATHGYLNHSAALGIVRQGLTFLAAELASAKPFQ
ncbi:alpha/beta hydrolase fold domain-containing protein [Arthrobacter sp. ES3-54]|uniref:alpha/beta hydrolase fold domain-containing protein n=1 Tax=Arthrobacter sp. ES3-54 TaxID=1502991 RepID=UPI00240506FD|nr:alpha/beta hydrolase fold domain-containing protein [Arthrobacter sp. ES3-54]MDF9749350.1 acetyl esterase [Arthrobacter sp. ES3-54]